jgi:hypothetical protein
MTAVAREVAGVLLLDDRYLTVLVAEVDAKTLGAPVGGSVLVVIGDGDEMITGRIARPGLVRLSTAVDWREVGKPVRVRFGG